MVEQQVGRYRTRRFRPVERCQPLLDAFSKPINATSDVAELLEEELKFAPSVGSHEIGIVHPSTVCVGIAISKVRGPAY